MLATQASFFVVGTLVFTYVGLSPTYWLLPKRWKRLGWAVAPLVGYCAVAVLASILNSTIAPMSVATVIILAFATLANGWTFFRSRPSWVFGWEQAVPFLLAASTYLAASLPLLRLGSSTALLGEQWDLQLYLPLTEYLKHAAVGGSITAPASPLLHALNDADVRGGSGWGFSYLDAMMGVLLNRPSLDTFSSTLHLVLALSVLSVYVFCRGGLRLSQKISLLASGLWALNGLALWLASVGFAGHAATFLTLPFALATTLWALHRPSLRNGLLAGLVVSGLLLTYYTGALLLYGAAVAVWAFVRIRRSAAIRRRTVIGLIAIAATAACFGVVGHLRFLEVINVYQLHGFTNGPPDFRQVSFAEALGLAPFFTGSAPASLAPVQRSLLDTLGLGLALLVIVRLLRLATRPTWQRAAYVQFVIALAVLAYWLRIVMPYPYGYFKLLSLGAFLFPIALAVGVETWWRGLKALGLPGVLHGRVWSQEPISGSFRERLSSVVLSPLTGAVFSVLTLALTLTSFVWTLNALSVAHAQDLSIKAEEWMRMAKQLPAGSSVYVNGADTLPPRGATLLYYALLDHPIGLSRDGAQPQGYAYGILLAADDPRSFGLSSQEPLWSDRSLALYRVENGRIDTATYTATSVLSRD